MSPADRERVVQVGEHELRLSNLSKVLFPATGTTKAELINYYAKAATTILPHLRSRLVTLKRYPDGVDAESFFEKACPKGRPDWVRTAGRFAVTRGRVTEHCLVEDVATLVWLANLATIELHVPLADRKSPDTPRAMVFDLDPGEGASITECVEVALIVRERLAADGLIVFPKVSGSKGIQAYVPLNNTEVSFEQTKAYARSLAEELAHEHPDLIVSKMRKTLRREKVLIDWSQNDDTKTTVCVYSVRGRRQPNVSMPVGWEELEKAWSRKTMGDLVFPIDAALTRMGKRGNDFRPVLEMRQKLPVTRAAGRRRKHALATR